MADVDFISSSIQSYYNNTAGAATFRTGGSVAEDGSVKSLDSRIASFEQVIIDNTPAGSTNAEFPYDAAGLKREFLDEVMALLLSRSEGTKYLKTVKYDYYTFDGDGNHVFQRSQEWTPIDTQTLVNNAAVGTLRGTALSLDLADGEHVHESIDGVSTGNVFVFTSAPQTYFVGVKNFDDLSEAQKKSLLNPAGVAVYDYYSSLIDQVFAAGQAMKAVKDPHTGEIFEENDNQTLVVTAIDPLVFGGVTYDHVTSFRTLKSPAPTDPAAEKYNYVAHLVEAGLETYVPMKVPILNTATPPRVVGFKLGFSDATTQSTKYLPVELVNGEYVRLKNSSGVDLPPVTLDKQRNMYIDDYLYFWTEARTGILRAQLAYKEAVTREMQEDLRQANDALAELERLAAQVNPPGGNTGHPSTNVESLALDLWEAKAGKPGDNIFNNSGNDDIQNYETWQESRTNLKNYIDRKSAQSQQAMLDYQTVLNRYNNAFEVMSKIQEKIDSLLKSQLRNYN
jgi:hypothetical protein